MPEWGSGYFLCKRRRRQGQKNRAGQFVRNSKHLTIKAPAKVNLYLEVTGRRDDGYHDLLTFMQKLELTDVLQVTLHENGEGVVMTSTAKDLPVDKGNLAVRAAYAFLAEAEIAAAVEVDLDKRIPIAAGLGGGSSDAAAVLVALNSLAGYPLSPAQLQATALSLGADVPFLTSDFAAAWATGVGEKLQAAAPIANCLIVVVNPGFPVSTKWVFESYGALAAEQFEKRNDSERSPQSQTDNLALTTGGNPYILGREKDRTIRIEQCLSGRETPLYNDLETVTIKQYPELAEIKNRLLAHGADGALMSGSGPTVFGLFDDEQQARASYNYFLDKYGENVFLTKPQQNI